MLDGVLNAFLRNHQTLGFTKAWQLTVRLGPDGPKVTEFTNPRIPGTGEFAVLVLDRFLLIANSGPLLADMARAALGARPSIGSHPSFAEWAPGLPDDVGGVAFVDGQRLAEVLKELHDWLVKETDAGPDSSWVAEWRPDLEADIFASGDFAPATTPRELDRAARRRFEERVQAAALEGWRREDRPRPGVREHVRRLQETSVRTGALLLHVTRVDDGVRLRIRCRK